MDYVAEKLGHPSAEVRGRALESLEFKWKYGLIRAEDLLQDRRVLRGLIGLLGLGDGPQTTAVALLLLRKMAAADGRLARGLLEVGALQQLQATTIRTTADAEPLIWIQPGIWPDELLPSVEALARLLLGFQPSSGATSAQQQPAAGLQASNPAAAAAAGEDTAGGGSPGSPHVQHPLPQAGALRRSVASAVSAGLGSDAAGSPPLARTHLSSGSLGSAGGASPSGPAALTGTARSTAAAGVRSVLGHSMGADSPSAGSYSGAAGARAGATSSPEVHGVQRGPGSAAASGDTSLFDERLLRARAQADWRQMEAAEAHADAGVPLCGGDSSGPSGPPAGHLTLPVVSLSAADDQALFELNVRLQYSDDERLLLPALLELSGAVGLDLPAEALLLRPSILDNCLALVGSSKASRAVQQAAAAALLQLTRGLQQSLEAVTDPELCRSEYGDAAAAAAEAAATGKPVPLDLTSCLNPPGSTSSSSSAGSRPLAGFNEAAKALAAAYAPMLDPSCPNSYPQLPLPELCPDTVWRLPAGALQGAVVDVTAAVASICLQTVELLKQPERHYELLPLLEEALPLLAAPLVHLQPSSSSSNALQPSGMHHQQQQQQQQWWQQQRLQLTGDQRQQLQRHLQAVWRGLLAALSRALAACSAVGAADRAAAASASLAGGSGGSAPTAAVAAVVAAVPPAAAAGAAALAAGGGGDGGLCVWDPPTLNLLMLALRWANAVPTSWLTPSLVPASLADTLAAAACDEALDLLLPQLRQGARPLLQQLRPGALQALREAHAVPAAWDAGESAREQLQTLQQQLNQQTTQQQQQQHTEAVQSAVAGWLNKLQDAFPGLGYAPRWDAKLLHAALQGLSLVAAAAGGANGAGPAAAAADAADRAAGVMVALLRHHSPTVQQLVWQLLQSAVAAAAGPSSSNAIGATDRPVLHLLLLPLVLECLVVEQLSSLDSKPAACTLLMALLQHGGSSVAQQLLPWRPWVSSCAGDTASDALNEALAAFLAQGLGRQPGQGSGEAGFWAGRLAVVLQDLFSSRGDVRRAAGRQLLLLMLDNSELPPEDLDVTDDPFKGLLGAAAAAAGTTAAAGGSSSSSRFLLPPDPLTDASASLAAAFSRQDVLNLLAVLANKGLAQELRRAAAEELLALAPDPHLLAVMAQQAHLDAIWQLCVPPESEEEEEAVDDPLRGLSLSRLAVGAGDPSGSIFDMQLPIAGLHLLAGLLARSPQALDWVTQQPDRLLQPLLPLVLHSLSSVRKAVGRVLALVVFGHAAQQWRGFAHAALAATTEAGHAAYQPGQRLPLLPPGAGGVLLPLPFSQQYKFPFKVTWLPVEAEADQAPGCDTQAAAAGQEVPAGAAAEPDEVLLVPEQHRQQRQQQRQRGLVRQLVEQQQILRAAAAAAAAEGSNDGGGSSGVAAAARRLLSDCLPVELSHISQRVMAATAATLVLDDPAAVAARCLAAVAAAGSHEECTHALSMLQQQLGSTSWGLVAVLQNRSPGWLQALSRLLGTAPVTREDQSLWLMVLQLLERLLLAAGSAGAGGAGSSCSVAVYTQLQLLLQRSLSVWLQQPAAAAAAPRPPLALAAGSGGWEAMRAAPSSAAAAAVVADALGLGGSSAPAAAAVAAGVGANDSALAVRVSRQALSTLLGLMRAVKRDCSPAVGFYQHHQQQQEKDSSSSSSSAAAVACYSLSALKPCDLIRLLCECVVGVAEGVDYSCRVLASGVLCEVLAALQDVARTHPPLTPTTASAAGAAAAGSSGSVPAAAAGRSAGAVAQPVAAAGLAVLDAPAGVSAAVLSLLEAWICRALMPAAGRQLPGFTGKALVRCSLQGLCCVVQGPLVPEQDWTQAWADIGGTFWLSRLCRDREASIRVQALRLTAQLLHPGRTATQALVTVNWPDCVHRLTRVSSDLCEAHGVRAAALRGLAAAMVLSVESLQLQQQQQQQAPALPTSPAGQRQQQEGGDGQKESKKREGGAGAPEGEAAGTSEGVGVGVGVGAAPHTQVHTAPSRVRKLHGFGLAPLLQAEAVWQQLLPQLLLKWQQQPPTLTAAAALLAAVAAAAEPDGVGRKLLLTQGLAAAAVGVAAAGAGDSSSVSQERGGGPPTEPQSVTAVLQQQIDRLDAAAAALQLLALASAPASSGGGLLPLPAAAQAVVVAGPAAAVRLMCSIGSSLQAQQEAVSRLQTHSSASGGDAGALLRLQQQQLTAFRVAAAAVTASAGAWPEAARRQQLLPLLYAQASGGSGSGNSSSSQGAVGRPGELLCAVAVVLAHPACSPAVRLTCTQLLGLLLSDPQLAAAALGSPAAAEAAVEGGEGRGGAATSVVASTGGAYNKAVTESVLSCGDGSGSSGEEAIGAVLCRDLAAQLPSSIFLPSTAVADSAAQGSTGTAAAATAAGAAGAGSVSGLMGSTPAWAAAAAAESPGQLMVAPPDGLVVVFSLQNLLAFSRPAKAAALSIGLHRLLMEAALSMAAAVAGPAAGAAAAGGSGGSGAAARRTRARWFNTPSVAAAAQPTGGAGAASGAPVLGAGPSRKGNSGSVGFGRGGAPPDLPGFTAVAGVKRPSAAAAGAAGSAGTPSSGKGKGAPAGSSGSTTTSSRRGGLSLRSSSALKAKQRQQEQVQVQQEEEEAPQQQLPQQQAEQPAAGEAGEHQQAARMQPEQHWQQQGDQQSTRQEQQQQAPAGVQPADDASQHVSLLQQQLRQQQQGQSSDRQQTLTGSPGAGGTSSGTRAGLSKQQLQAACKQLNLRKLLMSVVLLRHLAHGCADTQAALTADGMVEVVLKLWPLALQHTPLLLELTRMLANTLPSCYEARLAAASLTGPPVSPVCAGTALSCLASLLVGQPLTPQLQLGPAAAAGGGGGSAFAAAAGTAAVVRAAAVVLLGYGSTDDGAAVLVKAGASCLPELAKAVRACIVSARREAESQQVRALNSERLAAVLQLLAVLAGRSVGQAAMLRPTVAPVLLELCAEVLQLAQQAAALPAALLLLRNLSFNAEVRSPLLANAALLPLLLAAAESLLAVLPAAERQQWQQRLMAADAELSAAAAELGCDCKPPKWDPMYETLGPGGGAVAGSAGGVGSAAGGGAGAATKLLAAGRSSRPGSPLVLVGAGGAVVPSAAGSVCCAVYAVSALWALVHNGEKVKAALRKLPAAAARLGVVRGYAEQLLLQQQQQAVPAVAVRGAGGDAPGGSALVVAAAAGGADVRKPGQGQWGSRLGPQRALQQQEQAVVTTSEAATDGTVWVAAAGLCGQQGADWWLEQLRDSCSALLDLMDAC